MFDFITVLGSIVDALMVEFAVSDEFVFWNLQFFNLVILKFYSFSGLLLIFLDWYV